VPEFADDVATIQHRGQLARIVPHCRMSSRQAVGTPPDRAHTRGIARDPARSRRRPHPLEPVRHTLLGVPGESPRRSGIGNLEN
jgi:hypothetical protein